MLNEILNAIVIKLQFIDSDVKKAMTSMKIGKLA